MNHGLEAGDWRQLTFRILLAAAAGLAVGYDRERRGKSAGLRTHTLVSVGAALFTMVPLVIAPESAHADDSTSRVVQGITAGIGFLGAGEILRRQDASESASLAKVEGLTTAAAIWVAAALGAVAGCGLWQLLLIGAVTTLIVLVVGPLGRLVKRS
jgi:putative Mg2+ transporter-C (MgtC) family protein